MHSVPERWYGLFTRISVVVALLFAVAAVVTWFVPGAENFGKSAGLTRTMFGLVCLQVFYLVFAYHSVRIKLGSRHATIVIFFINTMELLNLMQATGDLKSWYVIPWGVLIFASGMFGTYAIIGSSFVMVAYYTLMFSEIESGGLAFSPFLLVPLAVTVVAAIASYYIWRVSSTRQESQKVARLSSIVKSNMEQAEILIESLADGVLIFDTEGKVTLMNSAAAKMTEWPVDEGVGIDVESIMKLKKDNGVDYEGLSPFKTVIENKTATGARFQLNGRGDRQTTISLLVSPVMPDKKEVTGAVAVFRDVSAAFREEQQKAEFISTASHEMRTPVAAIEGYLSLALNENVSMIDSRARDYLQKAHESTQHLGQLFQDLLTSAKAEDGRLTSRPEVVEMGSFMEDLAESLRFSALKKTLQTEFVIGSNERLGGEHVVRPLYYIFADPERIREVVTNLFDNAVKYTATGKITVGLTGDNNVVQIYVRDTGMGISEDDLPHVFQKFYRVDNSDTRTIGGTGLGLFICAKIVELYKGRIWVESKRGKGSTFYINLPRLSTQRASELQPSATPPALPAALPKGENH